MRHIGNRQVGQNAAKADRDQQQRLKALANGQVDEAKAHQDHHRLAGGHVVDTRGMP